MWQHMFCVSAMRAVWRRELQLTHPHICHTMDFVVLKSYEIWAALKCDF